MLSRDEQDDSKEDEYPFSDNEKDIVEKEEKGSDRI
jgi:hypothetical protein